MVLPGAAMSSQQPIARSRGPVLRAVVWLGWLPLRLLLAVWHGLRWLVHSFRFWALLTLAVIALLIAYQALSDRYTPLTTNAYAQAYVIQIAPEVAGRVVHVYVREGDQVKAGTLLFELERRPFEHKLAYWEAKLVEAEQQVKQLNAEQAAAKANHKRLLAEAEYAASVHRQESAIFKRDSTTERKYLEAVQKYKSSQAAVKQSIESVRRVEDALAARINGEHSLIAQARAQLADARLNLAFTEVKAPCDGTITDLHLRTGDYVHVGQAGMTLIDTTRWLVVANFRENSLVGLSEGQPALVALRGLPGELLQARVDSIGWGVGQGQGVPSGLLPDVKPQNNWIPPAQRFQVRLLLEDGQAVPLRVGMTGSVSVYTEPDGSLNEVTRAWHQVIAWLYYF
jgi:multidrug resistance efflux pump